MPRRILTSIYDEIKVSDELLSKAKKTESKTK